LTAESWTFAAGPEAPGLARRLTGAYAARHGVDADTRAAIALCVSEAVTNVVLHAYRDADEPQAVEVEVQKPDDFLCLYVRDRGIGFTPRVDSPGLGLGLPLISNSSSSIEVRSLDSGGTELAMRFDLLGRDGFDPIRSSLGGGGRASAG
jgi:serine/threonine-protein kinase RsbW